MQFAKIHGGYPGAAWIYGGGLGGYCPNSKAVFSTIQGYFHHPAPRKDDINYTANEPLPLLHYYKQCLSAGCQLGALYCNWDHLKSSYGKFCQCLPPSWRWNLPFLEELQHTITVCGKVILGDFNNQHPLPSMVWSRHWSCCPTHGRVHFPQWFGNFKWRPDPTHFWNLVRFKRYWSITRFVWSDWIGNWLGSAARLDQFRP